VIENDWNVGICNTVFDFVWKVECIYVERETNVGCCDVMFWRGGECVGV
jgi:hypothetical protein